MGCRESDGAHVPGTKHNHKHHHGRGSVPTVEGEHVRKEDGAPCVCVLNKKRRDVFNIAVKIRTNVPNLTYL